MSLTSAQVSQWLRARGQLLIDAADVVEDLPGPTRSVEVNLSQPAKPVVSASPSVLAQPTVEDVRRVLSAKQHRVGEIAKILNATPGSIKAIVSKSENGFEQNAIGWVKIKV